MYTEMPDTSPAPNSEKLKSVQETLYDRILIGGGLASLFTAYATLREAAQAGKKLQVLVLTKDIHAPSAAGSHVVNEMEGLMKAGDDDFSDINTLLHAGLKNLSSVIAEERIECRYSTGYEIKTRSREELDSFSRNVTQKGIFRPEDMADNSNHQIFNLPGFGYSLYIDSIGQLNTPELLQGMTSVIRKMGGQIVEGVEYTGHGVCEYGLVDVETNYGRFNSFNTPFMGTGPEHQTTLVDFDFGAAVHHVAGAIMGPLRDKDLIGIAKSSVAIADGDPEVEGLWGGVDPRRMMTFGWGAAGSREERANLEDRMLEKLDEFYPGLSKKYPPRFSHGAILQAPNGLPIVGRMQGYDVAGGWSGVGIVPGFAAATAFAKWYVNGDDSELRVFEDMQPERFRDNSFPAIYCK